MNIFSSRLKYLRESKGLTQTQLAREIGISNVSICKYEKGDKNFPTFQHLISICKYFNVSLDYLCGTEYYLNENEEKYFIDDKLHKIIKRNKILSNYILENPRVNVKILENIIKKIK